MQSRSNIEIMTNENPDEIIEELFDSFFSRYQISVETQIWENDFIFDLVNLLYYKCHKTNFKCGGSFSEKKKAAINPKNDHDKCFQSASTIPLNFEKF